MFRTRFASSLPLAVGLMLLASTTQGNTETVRFDETIPHARDGHIAIRPVSWMQGGGTRGWEEDVERRSREALRNRDKDAPIPRFDPKQHGSVRYQGIGEGIAVAVVARYGLIVLIVMEALPEAFPNAVPDTGEMRQIFTEMRKVMFTGSVEDARKSLARGDQQAFEGRLAFALSLSFFLAIDVPGETELLLDDSGSSLTHQQRLHLLRVYRNVRFRWASECLKSYAEMQRIATGRSRR